MESDMICLCDTEDPVEYLNRIKEDYLARTKRLEQEQQNLEIKILQVEEFLSISQSTNSGPSDSSSREVPKVFPKYQDTPTRERASQRVPKTIIETCTEAPGFFQKFRSMITMTACRNPNMHDAPTKDFDSSGPLTSQIGSKSVKNDISRSSSLTCNCEESDDISTSQDTSEATTSCLTCVGTSTKFTPEHKTQTKKDTSEVRVKYSNKDFSSTQTSQSQTTTNKSVEQKSPANDLQVCQCDSSFVDNKKLGTNIFASPTSINSQVGADTEPKKVCSANKARDERESAIQISKSKGQASESPVLQLKKNDLKRSSSDKETSYGRQVDIKKSKQIETSNISKEDANVECNCPNSKVVNIQASIENKTKNVNTDGPAVLKNKSVGSCLVKTCPGETRYTQCAFIGSPMLKPMDFEQANGDNIVEKDEVIQQPKSPQTPQRSKSCDYRPMVAIPCNKKMFSSKTAVSFPNQDINNVEIIPDIILQNQITSINQIETSCSEMHKNLGLLNQSSCICNPHFSLPPKNFEELENKIKKVSNELKFENTSLKSELMELKLQLNHTLENVEGPMKQKLDTEKLKCECLQDELNETSKSFLLNQDTYQREINCLKMQLCVATAHVTELNQGNEKLKNEIKQLDLLCNKLEDDLIKQKLNEADTIKRLTSRRKCGAGEGPSVNEFRCPSDLEVITRQLSNTLKEVPCDECTNIPKELRGAAKCIKDLADIVLSNKKQEDYIFSKGASRGDFQKEPAISNGMFQPISDIPEEAECDCACCCGILKPRRKEEQVVKTLHPVSPDFAESSTFNVGKEQSTATSQQPGATLGMPYSKDETLQPTRMPKAVCDQIGRPCSKSAQIQIDEAGDLSRAFEGTAPYPKDQETETKKDLIKDSDSGDKGVENLLENLVNGLPLKDVETQSEDINSKIVERKLGEDAIKSEPTESFENKAFNFESKSNDKEKEELIPDKDFETKSSEIEPLENKYSGQQPTKNSLDVKELTSSLPFEEQRFGNFPFDVKTKVTATKEPLQDLYTTTTVTDSGTLEVITEGPKGMIETTLTYTDEGNIEVVTEMFDRKEKEYSANLVIAKLSKDSSDFFSDKDEEKIHKINEKLKSLPVDSSMISGPSAIETPYSENHLTQSDLTSKISSVSQAIPPASSLTGTASGTRESEQAEANVDESDKLGAEAVLSKKTSQVLLEKDVQGIGPKDVEVRIEEKGFESDKKLGAEAAPSKKTSQILLEEDVQGIGPKDLEVKVEEKGFEVKQEIVKERALDSDKRELTGEEILSTDPTSHSDIASEAVSSVSKNQTIDAHISSKPDEELSRHPKQSEEIFEKRTDYEKIPAKEKIVVDKISSDGKTQIKEETMVDIKREYREESREVESEKDNRDTKFIDATKREVFQEKLDVPEKKSSASEKGTHESIGQSEFKQKLSVDKQEYREGSRGVESEKDNRDSKFIDPAKREVFQEKLDVPEKKSSASEKGTHESIGQSEFKQKLSIDKQEYREGSRGVESEKDNRDTKFIDSAKREVFREQLDISEKKSSASKKGTHESNGHLEFKPKLSVCESFKEKLKESELALPVKKKGVDCSCQSEDQTDQSCQCCECKEIGVATSGDKETTTEETIRTTGLPLDQQSQESDSEFITISEATEPAVAEDLPKQIETSEATSQATSQPTTGGVVSAEIQPEQMGDYLPIQGLTVASLEDEEPPEDLRNPSEVSSTNALNIEASITKKMERKPKENFEINAISSSEVNVAGSSPTKKTKVFDQSRQSDHSILSEIIKEKPPSISTSVDNEKINIFKKPQASRDMSKEYKILGDKSSKERETIIRAKESTGLSKTIKEVESDLPQKDQESVKKLTIEKKDESAIIISDEVSKKPPELAREFREENAKEPKRFGSKTLEGKQIQANDVVKKFETPHTLEQKPVYQRSTDIKDSTKVYENIVNVQDVSEKYPDKEQQKLLQKASHRESKIKSDDTSDQHNGVAEAPSIKQETFLAELNYLPSKDEVRGKRRSKEEFITPKESSESHVKQIDFPKKPVDQTGTSQEFIEKYPLLNGKSQKEQINTSSDLDVLQAKGEGSTKRIKRQTDSLKKMATGQEITEIYPELEGKSLEEQMKTLSDLGVLPTEILPIEEDILRRHLEGKSLEEKKMVLEKLGDSRGVSDESKEHLKQLLCGLIDKLEESAASLTTFDKSLSCKAICRSQATIYDETQVKQAREKDSIGDVPAIKGQRISSPIPAMERASATYKASGKTIAISDHSVSAAISTEFSRTVSTQERPTSVEESASCRASCRNIAVQGSKPKVKDSALSPGQKFEELLPARNGESLTSSSSSEKDRNGKKMKKQSLGEVPLIVSKLSDRDMGPPLERPRKQPRKKRSASKTLGIIKCDCGDICRCIICTPDVMERRRGPCVCGRPPIPVDSQATSMVTDQKQFGNKEFQKVSAQNQARTSTSFNGHTTGCTCMECKCNPCTPCPNTAKPGGDKRKSPKTKDCSCKNKQAIVDKVSGDPRTDQPAWVSRCVCPGSQKLADRSLEESYKCHAKDCECVDCLTMPKIKKLAQTKEYPIIYEKKQVFTVNCDCKNAQNARSYIRSRIPVPIRSPAQAQPAIPLSRSQLTRTEKSPVSYTGMTPSAISPRPGSAGNYIPPVPCDCEPCRCESCPDQSISKRLTSKIKKDDCCCQDPCTCEKCPIKDLQKLSEQQIIQSSKAQQSPSQIQQGSIPDPTPESNMIKKVSSIQPPNDKPTKTISSTKPPSDLQTPKEYDEKTRIPESGKGDVSCYCNDPCYCPQHKGPIAHSSPIHLPEQTLPSKDLQPPVETVPLEDDIPCTCDDPCDCPGEKPQPKGPTAHPTPLYPSVHTALPENDIPCTCDDPCDCPGEKPAQTVLAEGDIPCTCDDPCDCPGEKPQPKVLSAHSTPLNPPAQTILSEGDIPCICDDPCDCPGEKPQRKVPSAQSTPLNPPAQTVLSEGEIPCICDDPCDCPGKKVQPKQPSGYSTPLQPPAQTALSEGDNPCLCDDPCDCPGKKLQPTRTIAYSTPLHEIVQTESAKDALPLEDCVCDKLCDCSDLEKYLPTQVSPVPEIKDECVDCKCCRICECPGKTNLLKKVPSVKSSHKSHQGIEQRSMEPILEVPCNCVECKCNPCADPTKKGKIGICGSEDCKCDPCADPDEEREKQTYSNITKPGIDVEQSNPKIDSPVPDYPEIIIHPSNCDCEECNCLEKTIKASADQQTGEDFVSAKSSHADKEKFDDCTCEDVCICYDDLQGTGDRPSSYEVKVRQHSDECCCDECVCVAEEEIASASKQASVTQHPQGDKSSGEKNCTCQVCICMDCDGMERLDKIPSDRPPSYKQKVRQHPDECICDECVCVGKEEIASASKQASVTQHPQGDKSSGEKNCTCQVCICMDCDGMERLDKIPSDRPPSYKQKVRQHPDECICDECVCVGKEELTGPTPIQTSSLVKTQPSSHITTPASPIAQALASKQASVTQQAKGGKSLRGKNCTCEVCICIDCAEMERLEKIPKDDNICHCPTCKCDICLKEHDSKIVSAMPDDKIANDKSTEPREEAKYSDKVLSAKPSVRANESQVGDPQVKSPPKKESSTTPKHVTPKVSAQTHPVDCDCPTCFCDRSDIFQQADSPKKSEVEIHQTVSEKPSAFVPPQVTAGPKASVFTIPERHSCNCLPCSCPICSKKPSAFVPPQVTAGPKASVFTIPERHSCNCLPCSCPICSMPKGKPIISPKSATENKAEMSKSAIETAKSQSKDASTSKIHPEDCICDVCACPFANLTGKQDAAKPSELAIKAASMIHPDDCTCDVCACTKNELAKERDVEASKLSVNASKVRSKDASTSQIHPEDCICDVCACPFANLTGKQDAKKDKLESDIYVANSKSREAPISRAVPEDCICDDVCSCSNIEAPLHIDKANQSQSRENAVKSVKPQSTEMLAEKPSVRIKEPSGTQIQEEEIGHTTAEGIQQVDTSTSRTYPDECICKVCSCVGSSGEKMTDKIQSFVREKPESSLKVADASTHGMDCPCEVCECPSKTPEQQQTNLITGSSKNQFDQSANTEYPTQGPKEQIMKVPSQQVGKVPSLAVNLPEYPTQGPIEQVMKVPSQQVGKMPSLAVNLPEICDCSMPCPCDPCADPKIVSKTEYPTQGPKEQIMKVPSQQVGKIPGLADSLPVEDLKKMPSQTIRKMPSATLKQEIQRTLGETCRCRNEILEIMKALDNIKCSCAEAELTISGKMSKEPFQQQQNLQKWQSLLQKSRQQMQQSQQQILQNQSTYATPSVQVVSTSFHGQGSWHTQPSSQGVSKLENQAAPGAQKMFIKKASDFGQTMAGLQMALKNLQENCNMKDRIIAAMTEELQMRGELIDYSKVFSHAKTLPVLEFDMASDVKSIDRSQEDRSQLVSNVMYQVDNRDQGTEPIISVSSKAVEVRTHRSKSRKCSKKCNKKDECNLHQILQRDQVNCQKIDLNEFEITDIRRITEDSLIVKWIVPGYDFIVGYDIYVNGSLVSKVMSGSRTSAMMHSLDLSKSVQIMIYAVTKCGRCEPPAIAIYEIKP